GGRPFRLTIDESTDGLEAVLGQEGKDGVVRPLYFLSRATIG
ncbi:unnamed protein product, partial [Discosporangium mesarthrocarpum]